MPVKVFGDSHVGAIIKAVEERDWSCQMTLGQFLKQMTFAEQDGNLHVVVPGKDGPGKIDMTLTPDDLCYFSGPFHTSRIARHPAWLTHRPSTLYDGGDALLVTPEELEAHIDDWFATSFAMLAEARRLGLSMRVIESPRLLPRLADLWTGDLAVVAEVDRLARAHVRRRIKAIGLPVMATPDHTHDGTWTLPEFAALGEREVHHGNRRFGAISVRRIEAHLARAG